MLKYTSGGVHRCHGSGNDAEGMRRMGSGEQGPAAWQLALRGSRESGRWEKQQSSPLPVSSSHLFSSLAGGSLAAAAPAAAQKWLPQQLTP